jgi:hypothetical protein
VDPRRKGSAPPPLPAAARNAVVVGQAVRAAVGCPSHGGGTVRRPPPGTPTARGGGAVRAGMAALQECPAAMRHGSPPARSGSSLLV